MLTCTIHADVYDSCRCSHILQGPPTGIELANGAGVLVPADHINSGNWGSHALINKDVQGFKVSGWKLSSPIDDQTNGGGNECQAAQLPNGTVRKTLHRRHCVITRERERERERERDGSNFTRTRREIKLVHALYLDGISSRSPHDEGRRVQHRQHLSLGVSVASKQPSIHADVRHSDMTS